MLPIVPAPAAESMPAPPHWLVWRDIEAIDVDENPSREVFATRWSQAGRPVKLGGLTADWPARHRWSLDFLTHAHGHHTVTVARRDGRDERELSLRDYIATLEAGQSADPYYLRDWNFRRAAPELAEDFTAPPQFPCYLAALDPALRERFSWIYLGPRHAASNFHRDVLATSAWNALLFGRKLWLFFPPDGADAGAFDNALDAFAPADRLAPVLAAARPLYCIQEPGETVFTPALWWHQVYNLETSLAITENFVDDGNLGGVLKALRAEPAWRSIALALAVHVGMQRQRPFGRRV